MFPGTVTVCAIVNEVNVSVTSAKLEPSFNLLGIFLNCFDSYHGRRETERYEGVGSRLRWRNPGRCGTLRHLSHVDRRRYPTP
jgi:hypothetical protein